MNPKTQMWKIDQNPILLVFLTLGVLLNLSCKKKNTEVPTPLQSHNSQSENPPFGYIKSITQDSYTEYFEYDSLNRIKLYIVNGDTGKYIYKGNILEYTKTTTSYQKYILNEMGFVVFPPGGVGQFYYDSLGYCLGFSTNNFYVFNDWKDGNLIRKIITYTCPDPTCYSDTTYYIYHLDSLNSIKGTREMIYGNFSKNVISRSYHRVSIGSKSFIDYTYEYDEKGRVIRQRQLQDSTDIKVISYQYFD